MILTHIDKVKPSLEKNLEMALESEKIQERVIKASKDVGVNSNRVFVVKNYTDERRTHKRQDILILRALDAILVDAYRGSREEGVRNTDRRRVHKFVLSSHLLFLFFMYVTLVVSNRKI